MQLVLILFLQTLVQQGRVIQYLLDFWIFMLLKLVRKFFLQVALLQNVLRDARDLNCGIVRVVGNALVLLVHLQDLIGLAQQSLPVEVTRCTLAVREGSHAAGALGLAASAVWLYVIRVILGQSIEISLWKSLHIDEFLGGCGRCLKHGSGDGLVETELLVEGLLSRHFSHLPKLICQIGAATQLCSLSLSPV